MAERPVKPGFYRVELIKTVWEVPEHYKDLRAIDMTTWYVIQISIDYSMRVRQFSDLLTEGEAQGH